MSAEPQDPRPPPARAGRAPRPQRCTAWLLAAALLGALGIALGVHHLLERGSPRAILAEADTLRWATACNAQHPGLLSRSVRGVADDDDMRKILESIRLTEVFRLVLFAPSGRAVFDTDRPDAGKGDVTGLNRTARQVFDSGASLPALGKGPPSGRRARDGRARFVPRAYVTAVTAGGFPIGVLDLRLDKSLARAVYRRSMMWLTLALPALSAVLYLAPARAFLATADEARCRAEALNRLTLRDPLTGALSRRAFSDAAAALFDARGPAGSVALMLVDPHGGDDRGTRSRWSRSPRASAGRCGPRTSSGGWRGTNSWWRCRG